MSYRVIQWSTGNVGRYCLRQILDHPELELAGLLVTSEAKDGKDAGDLCGRPKTGVCATRDADALLAMDADCVVYTPRLTSIDEVCAILESGKNVVTTAFLFHPNRIRDTDRSDWIAEGLAEFAMEGALLCFEHDPDVFGATLRTDAREEFVVDRVLSTRPR